MTMQDDKAGQLQRPLGRRAVHGVAWSAGGTLASKVAAFLGQIVLARALTKDDWGVVGLALTIYAFTGLIAKGGIRESLISRRQQFERWRNDAFWMSAAQGLAGGLVTLCAAPAAAAVFGAPMLTGMVAVLAVCAPLDGLSMVPEAELTAALRFRLLAMTSTSVYLMQVGLSVVLARMGYGAWSMIIPMPAVSGMRCLIFWVYARPRARRQVNVTRWLTLARDAAILAGTRFFDTVQGYTDYTVLGIFQAKEAVGVYFFAYNLSVQIIAMLAANLSSVLFPVLSQLGDENDRRLQSFIRAAKVLVAVSMPLCILQAVLAGPFIRLVYTAKWESAILPLQILSIGTAFRIVGGPATNLLQSQRRFKTVLWLSIGTGMALVLSLSAAAYAGGTATVALVESGVFVIAHIVQMAIAIGRGRRWMLELLSIYGQPVLLSVLAVGAAWLAAAEIPVVGTHDVLLIMGTGSVSMALYVALLRVTNRALWNELALSVRHLISRKGAADSTGVSGA